jgi:DNA-binding NarL/FixJ family response regulator
MIARSILIVSTRQSLQEGLEALLASIPEVGNLEHAHSAEQAMSIIENETPDLIVLDLEGFGEKVLGLLATRQKENPNSKSLVLVESLRQQTHVQVAGADVALVKGYPAHELVDTVQALLEREN